MPDVGIEILFGFRRGREPPRRPLERKGIRLIGAVEIHRIARPGKVHPVELHIAVEPAESDARLGRMRELRLGAEHGALRFEVVGARAANRFEPAVVRENLHPEAVTVRRRARFRRPGQPGRRIESGISVPERRRRRLSLSIGGCCSGRRSVRPAFIAVVLGRTDAELRLRRLFFGHRAQLRRRRFGLEGLRRSAQNDLGPCAFDDNAFDVERIGGERAVDRQLRCGFNGYPTVGFERAAARKLAARNLDRLRRQCALVAHGACYFRIANVELCARLHADFAGPVQRSGREGAASSLKPAFVQRDGFKRPPGLPGIRFNAEGERAARRNSHWGAAFDKRAAVGVACKDELSAAFNAKRRNAAQPPEAEGIPDAVRRIAPDHKRRAAAVRSRRIEINVRDDRSCVALRNQLVCMCGSEFRRSPRRKRCVAERFALEQDLDAVAFGARECILKKSGIR